MKFCSAYVVADAVLTMTFMIMTFSWYNVDAKVFKCLHNSRKINCDEAEKEMTNIYQNKIELEKCI